MAERILFPEFRNEQKYSRYPFVDSATLLSENEEPALSPDSFIDASFFGIDLGPRLYISRIDVGNQDVTIYVGDDNNNTALKATYDATVGPENGVIRFFDSFDRPAGLLLVDADNLGQFNAWVPGTYSFDVEATEFVSTVVIPAKEPGVRGVLYEENFIYGDMWLVGRGGVVIRKDADEINTIRVDVVGEPLFNRFACSDEDGLPTKTYLKTINNCAPDEFGNFTITATNKKVADPVLRIAPENNTLVVSVIGGGAPNAAS